MNDKLQEAMEKFAALRINFLGENEPEALQVLHRELDAIGARLRENMTAEQLKLLRDCEAVYSELDAETRKFYYEGGFRDAIQFLLKWGLPVD